MLLWDLNVHFHQPEHSKQVHSSLGVRDFFQHVDVPTHRHKHILDPLITRPSDCLVSEVKVQDKLISDHYLVSCWLHLPVGKPEKKQLTSRNVRGIDRAVFRTDLASALSDVTACDDPAQLVDSYNAVMTELLDKHAPLVSRCV